MLSTPRNIENCLFSSCFVHPLVSLHCRMQIIWSPTPLPLPTALWQILHGSRGKFPNLEALVANFTRIAWKFPSFLATLNLAHFLHILPAPPRSILPNLGPPCGRFYTDRVEISEFSCLPQFDSLRVFFPLTRIARKFLNLDTPVAKFTRIARKFPNLNAPVANFTRIAWEIS